ncbi:hypothetical protein QR98_0089890 [Sarcoptes scabiei]|uniref:Uncharacterized protein n=1 Tax=Sarcoptes scabiei TaxID=52283 RepID=A0A132AHG2_SARSC|nr:hypothetical protein QR98_0089890 [Sarcoptes scabiei]
MSEVSESKTKPSNLDSDSGITMIYMKQKSLACPNRVMDMFPRGTNLPMSPINEDLISRDNQCPPLLARILENVHKLKHSKPSQVPTFNSDEKLFFRKKYSRSIYMFQKSHTVHWVARSIYKKRFKNRPGQSKKVPMQVCGKSVPESAVLIPSEEPQQSNSESQGSSFPNACNSIAQSSDQLISNAHNENYAPVQVYDQPINSDYEMIPSEEPQQSTSY